MIDLLQIPERWTQSSVAAEDALAHQRGHRKPVEAIREIVPQTDSVSTFDLVVKSVNFIYTGALVIAAKQKEI